MKKIVSWFLILLIAFSGIILAEDTSEETLETDATTEAEAEAIYFNFGSRIRFLQLKKAVYLNKEKAKIALEFLEEEDTTNLQNIADEMEILYEEIVGSKAATNQEAVKRYVEFKKEATELSKEFRDEIRALIGAETEDYQELRDKLRDFTSEELDEMREELQELINLHNADMLERRMKILGNKDTTLLQKIRDGLMNALQVKSEIKTREKAAKQEHRDEINAELVQNRIEFREKAITAARENHMEWLAERAEVREGKVEALQARRVASVGSSGSVGNAGSTGSGNAGSSGNGGGNQ